VTSALLGLLREGIVLALLLAAPILVAALIGGVVAALLGRLTQLDDPVVSLVARVAAVALALIVFAPAIARELGEFGARLGAIIGQIGAG
jgi:flagellar biosynthetic protein FliQ